MCIHLTKESTEWSHKRLRLMLLSPKKTHLPFWIVITIFCSIKKRNAAFIWRTRRGQRADSVFETRAKKRKGTVCVCVCEQEREQSTDSKKGIGRLLSLLSNFISDQTFRPAMTTTPNCMHIHIFGCFIGSFYLSFYLLFLTTFIISYK